MNVRLKRARELAGYAVQLTKDEGLGTMLARGAGLSGGGALAKRPATCPPKRCWKPREPKWQEKILKTATFDDFRVDTVV